MVKGASMGDLLDRIYRSDNVRRAFWTLAQAAVGLVTVEALGIPVAYAAVVAMGLSAVKAAIAAQTARYKAVS